MIKTLCELETVGNFPTLIKNIYKKKKKHITYIIPNGKKPKTFPLRSSRSQKYLPLPFFSNVELEILTDAIRQVKEIRSIQIRKEDIKFYVFGCR